MRDQLSQLLVLKLIRNRDFRTGLVKEDVDLGPGTNSTVTPCESPFDGK